MTEHLPVLIAVVPLLAAPLAALVSNRRIAWALALLSAFWCGYAALRLLAATAGGEVITYELGGWARPYGIEYVIDGANAWVLTIVSLVAPVVVVFSRRSLEREIDAGKLHLFYAAFLLCLAGLLGIAATGDVFNVFVFLEISSLSAYALIAMGRDRRALTASYQYLIMGSLGATFIVIGIGLLYVMTGTLNMADLAERLPELGPNRTIPAAFTFLTVGITLKLALFPLHLWLPNAYTYAPSAVSAFLAATATKVAVYLLLRFVFTVFGAEFAFGAMNADALLIPLAMVAVIAMSLVAVGQENVKRLLAYSSVAQIGYIVLGIGFASTLGVTAGVLHVLNHALMKGALFLAVGCLAYRLGAVEVSGLAGIGRRMPWTVAAFVAGGLSIVGVPLTVGFVSKWYLVQAAIAAGNWLAVAVVLVGSLLAVMYVWKVVEVAYLRKRAEDAPPVSEAPLSLLLPAWAMVAANFYFGVDATRTTRIAEGVAEMLVGGAR